MRDGSLNGSGRRNRSLTRLKIVVLSPMPSASVKTATKVNPGYLRNWRMAKRRSFIASARRRFRGRGVDADTSAARSQQDGWAATVEPPAEMFVVCSGHLERQVGCNTTAAGPRNNVCNGRFRQSQINVSARTLQTNFLYRGTRSRSGDRAPGSFAG